MSRPDPQRPSAASRHGGALLLIALLCSAPAGAAGTGDAPFLWAVQSAATTHYLMGSVHLLPASAYPLPDALERAYADSRELVLETDLDAVGSTETGQQMLLAGLATTALARSVPAQLYARVQARARAEHLPADICATFTAWFCALTLGVAAFEAAGFDPRFGLDQHFHDQARRDGRRISWLESPDAQLALFTGMDAPMATQFLASSLDDFAEPALRPEGLVDLWRAHRVERLAALVEDSRAQFPRTYARLVGDRNRAWADALSARMRDGPALLVVVGAAHLVGPQGLPALLAERGYAVREVAQAGS